MKTKFTLAFIVCFIGFLSTMHAQVNKQDSLALVALYNSTNGPNWQDHTYWLTKYPVAYWHGVRLNADNRVVSLNFSFNDLSGPLPEEIGNLRALQELSLPQNGISGNLPESFGNLEMLTTLDLSYNLFTGSLPAAMGNWMSLKYIDVSGNKFTGSFDLFRHDSLMGGMLATSNHLSGNLPQFPASDTGMIQFILDNNDFTGTIPDSYISFRHLNSFLLNDNRLTGSIPVYLVNNFSGNFTYINLSHNNLSGTVPPFSQIDQVDLSYNKLSGSIPDNITTCRILDLSHNELTGSLPYFHERGALGSAQVNFSNNHLSGSISPSIASIYITGMNLSNNQLTGKIPILSGSDLEDLRLDHNQLTGEIPSLKKLPLYFLYLNDNQLTGKIPSDFGYSDLRALNLSNNQLTGSIPAILGNHTQLTSINLGHNQLTDTIPSSLTNLYYLTSLILSDNHITGVIPSSFNTLYLQYVRVNDNELSGTLPDYFRKNPFFKELYILDNHYNFDAAEPFVHRNKIDTFKYEEQKKIAIHVNGSKLSVYAGGTLSNNTYNWYRDSALVTTISGDSTFMPSTSGVYYVKVTNKLANHLTLNSDTISFDGSNSIIASAADNKLNSLSVYPNPATTTATLSFKATGKYTIAVTGISGVHQFAVKGVAGDGIMNTVTLPISRLSAGMYMVTVTDETGKKQLVRLSKQ